MDLKNFYSVQLKRENLLIPCHGVFGIYGPSSSGKTTLLTEMLAKSHLYFARPFRRILFHYLHHQSLYDQLERKLGERVSFFHGFDSKKLSEDYLAPDTALVFDDLDEQVLASDLINNFARGTAHHTGVTVILVSQSVFNSRLKYASSIQKNTRAFCFTKLTREKYALAILSNQLGFPKLWLPRVYAAAVENSYDENLSTPPHLILNLGVKIRPYLICLSNFVKADGGTRIPVSSLTAYTRCYPPPGTHIFSAAVATTNDPLSIRMSSAKKRSYQHAATASVESSTTSTATDDQPTYYYILSRKQISELLQKSRDVTAAAASVNEKSLSDVTSAGTVATTHHRSGSSRELGGSTSARATEIRKSVENRKVDANDKKNNSAAEWNELINETVPSMISLPTPVRQRMMRLARYLSDRGGGAVLSRDNNDLLIPVLGERGNDGDQRRRRFSVVGNVVDVLFFFCTPPDANVNRPRDLVEICRYFVKISIPTQFFHPKKQPRIILTSLRGEFR